MTQTVSDPNPMKKDDPSTEQLLLTLMKDLKGLKEQIKIPSDTSPYVSQLGCSKSTKGKQKTWFGPCKHCGFKNHLSEDYYGSSSRKAPMIPKPFKDCKYYGLNDHHSDECEYYPVCDICGLVKEICPKVVFGDNSSGDTEGYGLMNCNGITFTRVAYVNSLKHNLIKISQLCDANFNVLLTKTQGTIFNQNNEVMMIAPRRRDVYVIEIKMENLNKVLVKELRSDHGTEFRNHKLEKFCDEKGISQNFSSLCTSKQNGVAKRRNKTQIKATNTMLNSAKLPKQFWGEAVNTACYTQNRSIIVKRHGKTTYDVFRGRSPNISYFYVFGCLVHIHIHRDHLGKFNAKADDGFFLGYSLAAKAFRVFSIKRQEMEETYHVTFNEDDEAISKSSTEGDEINFNENKSFPDDEFFVPRNTMSQCSENDDYVPYVPCWDS
ncbi:retrovirus-related pol polyprotein from transposon TNT 1-94 [Tanacetum coccineum]